MNSRFCSKTRQQMFLFVSVRHVGAHQGAPAWRLRTISELFLWSESWRGSLKCTSFHFPDSGLYLLNGFDFYFDLFWMAWHRKPPIIAGLLGMVFASLWQFLTETAVHSPYFVLSPYFLYPVRSPQSAVLVTDRRNRDLKLLGSRAVLISRLPGSLTHRRPLPRRKNREKRIFS